MPWKGRGPRSWRSSTTSKGASLFVVKRLCLQSSSWWRKKVSLSFTMRSNWKKPAEPSWLRCATMAQFLSKRLLRLWMVGPPPFCSSTFWATWQLALHRVVALQTLWKGVKRAALAAMQSHGMEFFILMRCAQGISFPAQAEKPGQCISLLENLANPPSVRRMPGSLWWSKDLVKWVHQKPA